MSLAPLCEKSTPYSIYRLRRLVDDGGPLMAELIQEAVCEYAENIIGSALADPSPWTLRTTLRVSRARQILAEFAVIDLGAA
jgi:hypothetical protein